MIQVSGNNRTPSTIVPVTTAIGRVCRPNFISDFQVGIGHVCYIRLVQIWGIGSDMSLTGQTVQLQILGDVDDNIHVSLIAIVEVVHSGGVVIEVLASIVILYSGSQLSHDMYNKS